MLRTGCRGTNTFTNIVMLICLHVIVLKSCPLNSSEEMLSDQTVNVYVNDTNTREGTDKIEACTTHLERPRPRATTQELSSSALGFPIQERNGGHLPALATALLARTTKETNHAKDPTPPFYTTNQQNQEAEQ